MKTEVERDERIRLEKSSFINESCQRNGKSQQFKHTIAKDLLSGIIKKKVVKNSSVFCYNLYCSREYFNVQNFQNLSGTKTRNDTKQKMMFFSML